MFFFHPVPILLHRQKNLVFVLKAKPLEALKTLLTLFLSFYIQLVQPSRGTITSVITYV